MLRQRFIHRLLSGLIILSLLLSSAPLVQAQDGPVFLPLINQGKAQALAPASDLIFRVQVRVATASQAAKLAQPGIVVLAQGEDAATLLVDAAQLEYLAKAGFQPRSADALEPLVQEQGADWLSPSLQPLMQEAAAARERLDLTAGRAGDQVDALAGVRAAMSVLAGEQRAALNELTELDDDGDGLTNTEESWWCTDALNPDSNGDGYLDGATALALLNYALPRQQRHAYGPPFRLWPPFVDTIAPGERPTCLLDADHDSIPDLLELYVIGTSPRDESTDGDKFDDGQEFFGITYCPGAPNSCGYGSYPRTQDFSFITDRLPSWVRPPGDNPFVAAYPVIEFNVDPATIRVVTKKIETVERTITQGEEISSGYAETKGNSTTVGTVDTNTRSGWQEHSTTEGGIEPSKAATPVEVNFTKLTPLPESPTSQNLPLSQNQASELQPARSTAVDPSAVVLLPGPGQADDSINEAVHQALASAPNALAISDHFTISALDPRESGWLLATVAALKDIPDTGAWNVADNAVWFGLVILKQEAEGQWSGAVEGTPDFTRLLNEVPDAILNSRTKKNLDPLNQEAQSQRSWEFGYNFPWKPGTKMLYSQGPHPNGKFGWTAIDLASAGGIGFAPNEVRAARGGNIKLLCNDHLGQAWIQIDSLTYLHLVYDDRIHRNDEPRMTGDYLGALMVGPIANASDHCGYSTQNASTYHLHLGIESLPITFEGWELRSNGTWYQGSKAITSGQNITASGDLASDPCNVPSVKSTDSTPNTLAATQKRTSFIDVLGRTLKTWWGKLTGGTTRAQATIVNAAGSGCSGGSCSSVVSGGGNYNLSYSDNRSAGQCGGNSSPGSSADGGIGGGGSGLAYNDNGGGNFTALRTWSETTTTGEGWSTSHSDVRMETEYAEITRSTVNTLVSTESWATATTADPTDAARMTFNYTLANTGSDLAVQVTGLRANILIGDLPVITVNLPDRTNIEPSKAKGPFSSDSIPLTLDQLAAIDNGAPIRVVLADYGYNDSLYDTNAWGHSVLFHIDDGIEDGDETFDTYLITTNLAPGETYQETLARYFPVTVFEGGPNDPRTGTLTSITTPEYDANGEITSWIARPVNERAWWELALSTGGETAGVKNFKDMPAKARSYVYLRYMVDTDGDGYTDRTERDAGTDRNDPDSHPRPLLVAAKHTQVTGSTATVQLALQNLGDFDASSVEIWAIAPDDSITIDDNLIGGGGRVRAGRRVVLGARIGAPDLTAWATSTAKPAPGGQFDGAAATTFQFRADTAGTVGSSAGLQVSWSSDGATWTPLNVGSGYTAWTPLALRDGVSIAFSPGTIAAGETFRFDTALPIDTFGYTINRTPPTPPLLVVAYNDAQGNHKFVADVETSQIQEDLTRYYAEMRRGLQFDMRQAAPFQAGANRAWLTLYNPSDRAISGATLAVEIVTPDGALAKEYVLPDQTFQPGPNVVTLDWNTADFSSAFDPAADYHVLAYAADRQGTIIEHTLRSLDTLAQDALPTAIFGDTTWNFGTVTQGEILERTFALANVGFADLQSRALLPAGLTMTSSTSRRSLPGDIADFTLTLDTRTLPTGPYSGTVALRTSDPANPLYTVQVNGVIEPLSGDAYARTITERPLDVEVWVPGNRSQGEWISFTHPLGPDPASLHPVKVYSQDGATLYGVGKYATDFSAGTASYDMFGDGRDGVMPGSGNLDNNNGFGIGIVNSGSAGATSINVTDAYAGWRINPGDVVLIHQTQGTGAGCWEMNKAASDYTGGTAAIQLVKPLKCNYASGGNNHAQVLRVPQYSTCNVTGSVTPLYAWNGSTGGILAVMCSAVMTITGQISANGYGFRGGAGGPSISDRHGRQGESYAGLGGISTLPNGGGGGAGQGDPNPSPSGWIGAGGGGGGYGSSGSDGYDGGESAPGKGGAIYGTEYPLRTFLGSGGGGGGSDSDPNNSPLAAAGGNGGGFVWFSARSLDISGSTLAHGNGGGTGGPYSGSGGGASGGSISIAIGQGSLGSQKVRASGGTGGVRQIGVVSDSDGGNGGAGRIYVEYCEAIAGTTNPPASTQKLTCYVTEETESTPYTTSRLNLPETITGGRSYQMQYGRRMTFAAAGEAVTTLRVPAGIWTAATLDAMISGVGSGDVTFKIDVGADGVWDWEETRSVTNAATFSSPDLAAAFAPYVNGAGQVDVPVKVSLSKPGQVLLTNMTVTRNQSVELASALALSGTPTEGAVVPLNATVANSGAADSGPLTVSYYATIRQAQGDARPSPLAPQYIGSVFVPNIAANGSAPAPFDWNTLGFTGPVTVTAMVDPYSHIAETDKANNQAAASLTILTRPDLSVTAIALSDPAPLAGQPVSVTVMLRNGGQTASGAQTVALYNGAPDGGGATLGSSNLAVSAVTTRTVTFAWTPAARGHYRLAARADQTGVVAESDEGNNILWFDAYVGLASPVLLDSGAAGEPTYTPATGFGAVDEGAPDTARTCDAETQRSAPDGKLVYRFDHLQPGHYYHLDIHMAECDNAGRRQTVYVDGYPVSAVQDLGNGQPHRLSLLLDPALYADRTIRVTIEAEGVDDAIVDQVNLHDIDYRYADAGGSRDPQCTAASSYGWLDGTPNVTWGALPYRSLRIDTADNTLRYCFKALDPTRRYNVHFTFWQSTGTERNQMLLIDGVDTGLAGNVASGVRNDVTVPVPLSAYQDDGRIDVSIVRTNALTGAMANLVVLEEETLEPAGPDAPPGNAVLALSPSTASTGLGQTASMDIWVRTTQAVDGAAAYLDFNPALLQVASITPGSSLPTVLQRNIDNGLGRIDFAAGALTGAALNSDFLLATVVFTGVATTPGAPVTFAAVQPRRSDVTYSGDSVFHHSEDGNVIVIENVAALAGHVTPPGRPAAPDLRWRVPLRVTLSTVVGGPPVATFTPTSDESGNFVVSGISPGVYRVGVKMANSLRATVVVTFTATQTSVDFGALRGGDANDDNAVQLVDFSILRTTYGKCQDAAGYDARADFNGDDCVMLVDFSILRMNFGTGGDALRSGDEPATPPAPTVLLKAEPNMQKVAVGDVFIARLRVDAGEIGVDGAAAYLTFDPAVVQVVGVTAGADLPDLLQNEVDNQAGILRFAAGGLEQTVSGVFNLANVELRAVGPGDAKLHFERGSLSQSDVTAAGVSMLQTVVDATVTVHPAAEPEVTPLKIFLPIVGGWE